MNALTLISNNSVELFPNNEPGLFKTQLPGELVLEDGEWVIGLARVQIPKTWPTLSKDEAWLKITTGPNAEESEANTLSIELPQYHFTSIQTLLAHLNALIEVQGKSLGAIHDAAFNSHLREVRINIDSETGQVYIFVGKAKVTFTDPPNDNTTRPQDPYGAKRRQESIIISMSKRLSRILGFVSETIEISYDKDITDYTHIVEFSNTLPNVYYGSNMFLLYSDLVEEQVVSNVKAPLLATIPVATTSEFFINYEPATISWLVPSRSRVQTIACSLNAIDGKVVKFSHGQVVVTLHVARRDMMTSSRR